MGVNCCPEVLLPSYGRLVLGVSLKEPMASTIALASAPCDFPLKGFEGGVAVGGSSDHRLRFLFFPVSCGAGGAWCMKD